MRRWLVMTTYDENGEREKAIGSPENLDRMAYFTSGDGEIPMEGDLAAALEGYGGLEVGQEVLLFPLDAAVKVSVQTKTTVDVHWSVNVL